MIGFLIINYNDAVTTKKLLDNIKDYKCLDRILVVDNASTDQSYEELLEYQRGNIEIIKSPANRGYGAGINYGLNYLESLGVTYTFISNSDVVIDREVDLQKIIDRRKQGSILAPVIREHTGYNRGWKVPKPYQLVLQSLPFIYRVFMKSNFYSEEYYQGSFIPVEVVSFCFFFVSIADLQAVGLFDERVFLYFEENIMSCKLKKQNIYLCNDVEVFHNHSKTINKNLNRVRKYQALSKSKRYFAKNYDHAGVISCFLLWFIEKITVIALTLVSWVKA